MVVIQAKRAALPVHQDLRSVVILPALVLLVSVTTVALVTTLMIVLLSPVKMVPHVRTASATTIALVCQVIPAAIVQRRLMNVPHLLVRMVQIVLTFSTASVAAVRMDTLAKHVMS